MVAGLVAALVSGCSMGPQDAPVPVTAPTTSTPTPGPSHTGVPLTVQVYLVRGDRLARVSRSVPPGPSLEPSLRALAEPISVHEAGPGLRSALPTSSTPLRGSINGEVATLDLPAGFEHLSVHEQELAMAQLVFTITANSLATSVVLVRGGRTLPVPGAGGQLVTAPVTRSDYAAYAP